ncbi:MAG: HTH domain-containing protein [Thermoplasmata archaeon]|nr:HTH domain-containing protein [Thermoplasmata archaeon]
MYELRDRKRITLALILYELLKERSGTLRTIGERMGISPQGVANYLKDLEKLGFVREARITKEGIEFLHQTFAGLRTEISGIVSNLNLVLSTDAVAGEFIRAGETVSLYMRKGLLHAGRGSGEAEGVAVVDARPGEVVRVQGMRGIVPIERGRLRIVILESEVSVSKGKIQLPDGDVYGAYGLRALQFLERSGRHVDIRFSVPDGCVESAALGLNAVCVVTKDMLYVFLKGIQEAMQKYGEVKYEFI